MSLSNGDPLAPFNGASANYQTTNLRALGQIADILQAL